MRQISMDNRILKFQGFHPSEFTQNYLEEKIDLLLEEAPYGATLKMDMSRKDDQFKGMITIYSSSGRFFAISSGRKLKEVTNKLIEQIRKKLDRWKRRRFQHISLKNQELGSDSTMMSDLARPKEADYESSSVA